MRGGRVIREPAVPQAADLASIRARRSGRARWPSASCPAPRAAAQALRQPGHGPPHAASAIPLRYWLTLRPPVSLAKDEEAGPKVSRRSEEPVHLRSRRAAGNRNRGLTQVADPVHPNPPTQRPPSSRACRARPRRPAQRSGIACQPQPDRRDPLATLVLTQSGHRIVT